MHNIMNHFPLVQVGKNIAALLHNSPYGPQNNSL